MRALEAAALTAGSSEAELQQRAGTAVAHEVARLLKAGDRVAVLAGPGNNGRDGLVAAQWLLERGWHSELVLGPRRAITAAELQRLRELGGRVTEAGADRHIDDALGRARVAVDALAGIGTHGALREPLASLVRRLNEASEARGPSLAVVAVDLPSGLDADTGEVLGEVVWADLTVTLGAVKQGLLRFPAAERVGRLVGRAIGIPESAEVGLPYEVLLQDELAQAVPRRPLNAHKYHFGRVLVVAGSDHFLGAAVLCAGGAARAGAGLVTIASTASVRHIVAGHLPEATYTLRDLEVGSNPGAAAEALRPYLESHSAVVLGPGLGREPGTLRFVGELLGVWQAVGRPGQTLVVDADGLYALSQIPHWWERVGPHTVLTPHAGELARLARDAPDPGKDDGVPPGDEAVWAQAGRLAKTWGCCLVAKGPFTCVARPDGRVAVWPQANAALATAGTGDVLAGLCGGLLAQGASTWDAARVAVAAHGLAAARIVEGRGWRTLLASDLLQEIPRALADLATANRRR